MMKGSEDLPSQLRSPSGSDLLIETQLKYIFEGFGENL